MTQSQSLRGYVTKIAVSLKSDGATCEFQGSQGSRVRFYLKNSKRSVGSWPDGSVDKALVPQAWGPEFISLKPMYKPGRRDSLPVTPEQKGRPTVNFPRASQLTRLTLIASTGLSERSCLNT